MSRLGKKPIEIPAGVEVKIGKEKVMIKGPKGELARNFKDDIKITVEENFIKLTPDKKSKQSVVLWGTYAAHLKNMIQGVQDGFCKNLIIDGIGYKAHIEGDQLVLHLGFSHAVEMFIPEGIDIKIEKNRIKICGIDKEMVGQTSARIRAFKPPEPYKGKGIRYEDEIIRRKAGKKAAGTA